MMTTRLAILLAVAGLVDANPSSLVNRLGAPKYADREAASSALEKLGADALPALRAARVNRDAEVRSRAEVLVERIESDLLIHPTLVKLDYSDRPIGEIVKDLGSRGHANLALVPAKGVSASSRRISLVRPEPIPFWSAVEALMQAGELEMSGTMPMVGFGAGGVRGVTLTLFPTVGHLKPVPSSVSGPFRVTLSNLTFLKEKNFAVGSNSNNLGMGGFQGGMMPNGGFNPAPFQANGAASFDMFSANIMIVAEPRMTATLNGPVRLIEAVDDRGNSLVPPATNQNQVIIHSAGYNRFDYNGSVALQSTLMFKFPEQPGRTIRKIRGTVPLTISSRKESPLVIPLAEAKGNTYHNSEISLTIHDVKPEPNIGQTMIELTIRSVDPQANANGGFGQEFMSLRSPGTPQNQFEIADARGRTIPLWNITSQMQGPDGLRVTLRMSASDAAGVPSQVRYYEMARVNTEAEFEFTDVDMP